MPVRQIAVFEQYLPCVKMLSFTCSLMLNDRVVLLRGPL